MGITGAVAVRALVGTTGIVGTGILGEVGTGTLGRVGTGTLGSERLGSRLERRDVAPEMMLESGTLGRTGVAEADMETLVLGRGSTLVTMEVGIGVAIVGVARVGVARVGVGIGMEMLGTETLGTEILGMERLGIDMLGTEMLGTVTLGRPVGMRPDTIELMTETTLEMGMGAMVGVATAELLVLVCVCRGMTAAVARPAKRSWYFMMTGVEQSRTWVEAVLWPKVTHSLVSSEANAG